MIQGFYVSLLFRHSGLWHQERAVLQVRVEREAAGTNQGHCASRLAHVHNPWLLWPVQYPFQLCPPCPWLISEQICFLPFIFMEICPSKLSGTCFNFVFLIFDQWPALPPSLCSISWTAWPLSEHVDDYVQYVPHHLTAGGNCTLSIFNLKGKWNNIGHKMSSIIDLL